MLCFIALAFNLYGLALFLLLAGRIIDGLDGAVARAHEELETGGGPTDLGGFYDIIADFIFYSGFVFFFAVGQPQHSLVAAFLIFSFIGSGCSFLAYSIIATKHDMNHISQGKKSFYYLHGLAEGTETILVFILICLLPGYFAIIAIMFGVICWLTCLGRVLEARKTFGK